MAGVPEAEKAAAAEAMAGVTELRRRRGRESVRFDDVADHLVDFAARFPTERIVVDRVAAFLAQVGHLDHDHDRSAGSAGV